jgi:hypothetical protein
MVENREITLVHASVFDKRLSQNPTRSGPAALIENVSAINRMMRSPLHHNPTELALVMRNADIERCIRRSRQKRKMNVTGFTAQCTCSSNTTSRGE